jgi:hypothetical protein
MSFLQQLKQQASAVKSQQGSQVQQLEANVQATEQACQSIFHYFSDLAAQLNVIGPDARALSLDGKTRWPAMRLGNFRFDARKKTLRQREVTDYVALGWAIAPKVATEELGRVSVNFPPDLERVESRLRAGHIKHERLEQRHPDTGKLQALVFEHPLGARASVVFTADHDQARFQVRLACVTGLDIQILTLPASAIHTAFLDDVAKAIVGQPSSLG